MLVFHIGLCGLGIKRTVAEFNPNLSCVTFNFLICSATFWNKQSTLEIRECMRYAMRDKTWLVENAPAVRMARKKAYAKGKAEAKVGVYDYKQLYYQSEEKIVSLQQKIYGLETTVRTLTKMISCEEGK